MKIEHCEMHQKQHLHARPNLVLETYKICNITITERVTWRDACLSVLDRNLLRRRLNYTFKLENTVKIWPGR